VQLPASSLRIRGWVVRLVWHQVAWSRRVTLGVFGDERGICVLARDIAGGGVSWVSEGHNDGV